MENRILLISNIIFEPFLRKYLTKSFELFFSEVQLSCVPYEEFNEWYGKLQDKNIVIVYLNFDELYPNVLNDVVSAKVKVDDVRQDAINRCKKLYSLIKANTNAKVIWLGFEDYYSNNDIVCGTVPILGGSVDRINQAICDTLIDDIYIDFKRLLAKVGLSNAYNNKGKYRWNAPYSKEFIELMGDEVYKQYLIHTGKTKKCIVLDCDNVLWGGNLSEDGVEGIHLGSSGLGREYQDFQRFLLNLYYHGVILTVCSKNDEGDVLRVFREHSGMLLREEHIACFKVNWNNKPHNIKAIADTLNIGQDGMVFIDDSQFEIEAVKLLLPEISTILYDRDTVCQQLSWFNLKSNVDVTNINQRTQTYRTNIERKKLRESIASFDEYILSLDMKFDIHKSLSCELARIVELTQRTNKCTNGKRYTMEQIKNELVSSDYSLYTVCLSDKFSDLGVVGVIGTCDNIVDLFSLSCRALGRKIEEKMIQYILRIGANAVRFNNTSKNSDLKKLFESYGLMVESII